MLKRQIHSADLDIQQRELTIITKSCEQVIWIVAQAYKVKLKTHDLVFTEDELREFAGPYAGRLHAALQNMVTEGRAQQLEAPGEWRIF